MIQNGSFTAGAVGWQIYATPDLSYIVSNVTNGVMEFYRVPPPPGESNQAVVFQETGLALADDAPMTAQFDLGNSSTVRKRISVLILEHDFSDITMCTFTLPANAPLRTYGMRTHSTNAWTNAAIYFYAATEGSDGGFYQIDNVSLIPDPTGPAAVTQCIDPTVPAPGVGADSADLLMNGDFTAGLPPWVLFGQITAQVTAGVLEFVRPAGEPAGVILQTTGQALPSQDLLTARFSLGNSSTVRKRVTAILHDADFSDLAACTFYLEPGQPLAEHMMYAFTGEPWGNATVSFYPATVGTEGWMQLDSVSLKRTPSLAALGVECMEPAAVAALATTTPAGSAALTSSTVSATGGTTSITSAVATLPILTARMDDGATDWQATPLFTLSAEAAYGGTGWGWSAVASGTTQGLLWWTQPLDLRNAASARFRFQSRLATVGSTAAVEVSSDGIAWHRLAGVPGTSDWTLLDMDLSAYIGRVVFVRFVFDAVAPAAAGIPPDTWWIDDVEVEVVPSASGARLGTGL